MSDPNEPAGGPTPAGKKALERDLAELYDELRVIARRHLARERRDHSLQATALVHEAYLKLAGARVASWKDREHFLATAAQAIRRILVDHARRRRRDKRGGDWHKVSIAAADAAPEGAGGDVDVEALDEALEALAADSPRQARVVELRYFGGLTTEEIANVLGVSVRTVAGDWATARAWLRGRLREGRA